jgi:hypothetical protein
MKVAIMGVFLFAEIAIADYIGILESCNEARSDISLMLFPLGFIAGIFIKFRNFSWWRNCRFSKRFY